MMTREEAIKLLKQYQGYDPMFPDGETLKHAFDLTDETVDTLLAALRPVSREQVEQMQGEWMFKPFYKGTSRGAVECQKCKSAFEGSVGFNFCPNCGAPMTDEAMQMVMKRLEELYNA